MDFSEDLLEYLLRGCLSFLFLFQCVIFFQLVLGCLRVGRGLIVIVLFCSQFFVGVNLLVLEPHFFLDFYALRISLLFEKHA